MLCVFWKLSWGTWLRPIFHMIPLQAIWNWLKQKSVIYSYKFKGAQVFYTGGRFLRSLSKTGISFSQYITVLSKHAFVFLKGSFFANKSLLVFVQLFLTSIFLFAKPLHCSRRSLGIINWSWSQFKFFLVNSISSLPNGEPWEEDVDSLFGEPNPIFVLQQINVGLSELLH